MAPLDAHAKLSMMDTSKASGPGGICPHLLKEGAAELAVSLAAILKK